MRPTLFALAAVTSLFALDRGCWFHGDSQAATPVTPAVLAKPVAKTEAGCPCLAGEKCVCNGRCACIVAEKSAAKPIACQHKNTSRKQREAEGPFYTYCKDCHQF